MKGLGALRRLWVQVLIGVTAGVLVGAFWPDLGAGLKPLGDAFVNLVKMIIGPVIFCTIAAGIARMNDLKAVGRVGLKALIYFEAVSTLALLIGIAVALVFKPGAGFNIDPAHLDPKAAADYIGKAHGLTVTDFLMHIIPDTFVGAFTKDGSLLQVVFVAVLTGFGCARLGEFGRRCADGVEAASRVLFSIIHIVVRAAPVGAFGAMAFTIGKYGAHALVPLANLAACFAGAAVLFVLVVLGAICRAAGFSLLRYLRYIREELVIVLGAASSEAALPQLMEKMERLGAAKPVVGLVVPTGYSFNLDGTNIYMTLATLFLAQATNTPLSAGQLVAILLIAMLTSKGASGVTGAGFITLAATLAVVPGFPVAAIALLIGIDRFMSLVRSLTNFVGNGVAALVVARWEGQLDMPTLERELLLGPSMAERDEATEANPV